MLSFPAAWRSSLLRIALAVVVAGTLLVVLGTTIGAVLLMQPGVRVVHSTAPEVSPERLRAHVTFLAQAAWPRSYEQANGQRASDYVFQQFTALGLAPSYQTYPIPSGPVQRNVVVRIPSATGATATTPEGLIVVGAHVDSFGATHRDTPPRTAIHQAQTTMPAV